MTAILPLIQLALSLLGPILENRGVIGASTDSLITSLSGSAGTLIASIAGNKGQPHVVLQDSMAFMGTFSAVIAALKANNKIDPNLAKLLDAASAGVNAAMIAFVQAGKGFDVTLFAPIPEAAV